jgi:hypothetical protein
MLDAAMERHYSAAPGSFFTGGGTQGFGNFESTENGGEPTLSIAFQRSINFAFIRLMHDIVTCYNAQGGAEVSRLLADPNNPNREAYLKRFVDADSRHFLYRYYKDFKGLSPDQRLNLIAHRAQPVSSRLETVYLSLYPDARLAQFRDFLATPGAEPPSSALPARSRVAAQDAAAATFAAPSHGKRGTEMQARLAIRKLRLVLTRDNPGGRPIACIRAGIVFCFVPPPAT